jgi:hypothetical protein
VTEPARRHRLPGLEPDNLLAFLALLGLLRALEAARPEWRPRAAWDLDKPPLRPVLVLAEPQSETAVGQASAAGVQDLARYYSFDGRQKPDFTLQEATSVLSEAVEHAVRGDPVPAQLYASMISDAALKTSGSKPRDETDPTPLCLLGVAQTAYLKTLAQIARAPAPKQRSAEDCLGAALFQRWRRADATPGLRLDPAEDRRHAHRWIEPTLDPPTTEHGAYRLAIIGLLAVTCAPASLHGRVRLNVIGGRRDRGDFGFAWPIWRDPASLGAIRVMLSHPDLVNGPAGLTHLSVEQIYRSRRISVGKFMNFTRAEIVDDQDFLL